MDQYTALIALLALLGSVVAFGFTMFRYVQSQIATVAKEGATRTESAVKEFDVKNEATRKESELRMEKVAETESKARHTLANDMQTLVGKIETAQLSLARDAVRKDEMSAMEARLTSATTKLEGKVDHLQQRLELLPVLEAQSKANGIRLDRLLERFDSGVKV